MPRPRSAAPTLAQILAGLILLLAPLPVTAAGSQALTLEQIMADPDWIGTPPDAPYWADDGSAVYFERKRTGAEERDLYRVPLNGGQPGGQPVLVPLAE